MTERLDPLALPLRGSRLIEASAGTGKTWTISALYLRLVLGHGDAVRRPDRPLLPAEILVMTFTKAATRELAERIRSRLVLAAAAFRGEAAAPEGDAVLQGLLAANADTAARTMAAWRLGEAAQAMDDAAILTLDAWCQRVLREHAFDSGSLFDIEVQPDAKTLLAEAARDYWRGQVYPLRGAPLAAVTSVWSTPDALVQDIAGLVDESWPDELPDSSLKLHLERHAAGVQALKVGWSARAAAMRKWLDEQHDAADPPFQARKFNRAHYPGWLEKLRRWAESESTEPPDLSDSARKRLVPTGLVEVLKPGRQLAIPTDFTALEGLLWALDRLPSTRSRLRAHAAAHVARHMQTLKLRRHAFSHLDLQRQLAEALDDTRDAQSAAALRARLLERFPVALVDEFQDTSPLQLRILDRLYRVEADDPAHALLLIGDPKQSIYAFRGADIHSYLRARQATLGRHHALAVNRRSAPGVVRAVNRLFGNAEERPGAGAFLFRDSDAAAGAAISPLPFAPVEAHGLDERWIAGDTLAPAVTLAYDGRAAGVVAARRELARGCADAIVRRLNEAAAGFEDAHGRRRRLQPGDIAVLVRNRVEAAELRAALGTHGVPSVFLSDRDSVFDSAEARDLLRLLEAVAAPRDVRLARAALATSLLGLSWPELLGLADDEEQFDAHGETLRMLHGVWQSQGVLAMIRRALHAWNLPASWLAQAGGERRLTNVLHLAEMLQTASDALEGQATLVRWLATQISGEAAAQERSDDQILRLESDADRVQVVTVHKAKGLQYPLVFVPFATQFRAADRRRTRQVVLPEGDAGRRLVLDLSDADLERADHERLREDLRLLYVALTRAEHALWIGAALIDPGKGANLWHRSALGYLLSGAAARTPEDILADVQRFVAQAPDDIALQRLDEEGGGTPVASAALQLAPRGTPPVLLPALPYETPVDCAWSISSYSALVRERERSTESAAVAAAGQLATRRLREDEPLAETEVSVAPDTQAGLGRAPWHRFPRGALAGNLLHGLLEWLAGEGFALQASPGLQQALRRRIERLGWGHRAEELQHWLALICTQPLAPLGASLHAVERVLPEMEFWLPSDGLAAAGIDRLCRAHLWPGEPRPGLPERTLSGLLMGFADLVVEHQGRYWVIDYKSNALGEGDADYGADALREAVLAHRYDVQAALYLLPLHRLLQARLGAHYRPAQHIGGAIFVFLRGLRGTAGGCCHVQPPPALLEALEASLAERPVAGAAAQP